MQLDQLQPVLEHVIGPKTTVLRRRLPEAISTSKFLPPPSNPESAKVGEVSAIKGDKWLLKGGGKGRQRGSVLARQKVQETWMHSVKRNCSG